MLKASGWSGRARPWPLVAALALVAGCTDNRTGADTGPPDAQARVDARRGAPPDAGRPDARAADTGKPDAATPAAPDAATTDARAPADATAPDGPAPTDPCSNGTRDGAETDLDCGGGVCLGCELGQACAAASDCVSGRCEAGLCTTEPRFSTTVLFTPGDTSDAGTRYHSFRIPSLLRTGSGALLAFAEGRVDSHLDYGDIDIVSRRSTDDGETWGPLKLVFSKRADTCGNPTAVLDDDTGTIWLFASWNAADTCQLCDDPDKRRISAWGDRRVYSMTSTDDGITFGDLRNRTGADEDHPELVPPGHAWDAVGPGVGIRIAAGAHAGRLVVPAIGRNLVSDDHGATWRYMLLGSRDTSEGTVTELLDGRLMRNDRPVRGDLRAARRRAVSYSQDADAATWSDWASDDELTDPVCQASILRYNRSAPARLVFLNPDDTRDRFPMCVRVSHDEGEHWPFGCVVDADAGGYSSLAKTGDHRIAALTEVTQADGHRAIRLSRFNLAWIYTGCPQRCP